MKTATKIILSGLALAMLALFALLWPGTARAAEPSRCGAHATGLRADGTVWTGAAPRMWVGRDGYWHICQPWVTDGGDPEAPPPPVLAQCPPRDVPERWTQDGRECTAGPLAAGVPGRASVLMDEQGGTRGMAAYRCTPNPSLISGAEWRLEGSFCRWLNPPVTQPDTQRRHKQGDARVGAASWPGR